VETTLYQNQYLVYQIVNNGISTHLLMAFDVKTGSKKWEYSDIEKYALTPTVANGVFFLTTQGNKVYAIDIKTGLKRWEFTSSSPILESCAVVDINGKAYHSSKSGMVQ
jgi:eukaryotic-like serine/threonine-protein kinase